MALAERPTCMRELREFKDTQVIKAVTGMRGCGKSTLLKMFSEEILRNDPEASVLFYDFEDPGVLRMGDYVEIHDRIVGQLVPGKMNYVFLDEVQSIADFERMVASLHIKSDIDLYITGSNAQLLSGELATLLTGRYVEIAMLPFSFAEYYELANTSSDSPNLTKDASLANFLRNGGLPSIELFFLESKNSTTLLRSILSTILEKDIYKRHEIMNRHAFERILDFIMDSIGSLVSPRSLADTLNSSGVRIDKATVSLYLEYLCEAYLIFRVPRYDVKGKQLLQTQDKYYLADTGLREVRLGSRKSADSGHLLENAVYLELRRRNREVHVGKVRGAEVDFVVMGHDGVISHYQVAWHVTDPATLERELAPLRAIGDSSPKYLLTADWDVNPIYDGIRKLNVMDWLLGGK